MATCNINIPFTQPASELINSLRTKVQTQGGTFSGDETSGTISVPLLGSKIAGTYTISGQQVNIVITDKPFLVSCNQIQGYLTGSL